MPATNYLRLKKIRRLIYSGYTLTEVARSCGVEKREVKANIDKAKLPEEAKRNLRKLLKRNKEFSKKTLYIDTCGFKGADIKKVLERFPKVVVIRDVIDEMENYQFTKSDKWLRINIRWFLSAVAHKQTKNVVVVPTDDVSDEVYTDNRLIDYLKKLSSRDRKKAIVLTNDNGLSCKLQAYQIDYFGLGEIIQMQEEYEKLSVKRVKKNSESNPPEVESQENSENNPPEVESQENSESNPPEVESQKNSESNPLEVEPQENDEAKPSKEKQQEDSESSSNNQMQSEVKQEFTEQDEKAKVNVPNTILIGKTLYLSDDDSIIVFAGNGQIIRPLGGNLISLRFGNTVIMMKRGRKSKLRIHMYKIEDVFREKCGIDLGEIIVSKYNDIDSLDLPNNVKSKIRFYFAKFKTT